MTRKDDESQTRALRPWVERVSQATAALATYAASVNTPKIRRQIMSAIKSLPKFGDAAINRSLPFIYVSLLETGNAKEAENLFTEFQKRGSERLEVPPGLLEYMINPDTTKIVSGYAIKSRIPGITTVMTYETKAEKNRHSEYYAVRLTGRTFRSHS